MLKILIVADDLTGAADCAAACALHGLKTVLLLEDSIAPPDADVLAFDANTRCASAGVAAFRTAEIVRGHSADIVYKKIDSMLRGNPAIEVAAALQAYRAVRSGAIAVVAPAFPAMGRTTKRGWQYVRGERLANGDLSQLFPGAVICDAETDTDLGQTATQWIGRAPLWVGSAGLMRLLAEAAAPEKKSPTSLPPVNGRIVFAIGSPSERSREQVQALRECASVSDVIITGETTAVARAVAERSGSMGGLIVGGGETARAVLIALGIKALRVAGEVEAGVPVSISEDERRLPVITKAGDFGTRETLIRCCRLLR